MPPGSHRHRSLHKYTHIDGRRQVHNDMAPFTSQDKHCKYNASPRINNKLQSSSRFYWTTIGGFDFLFLLYLYNTKNKETLSGSELGGRVGWRSSEGSYLAFDCFCRNRRGATSPRQEGQTRLISLQRPLKFLPWDINEVIHRKTAARHTSPTAPANPLWRPFPLPPCHSVTPPGRTARCQGWRPLNFLPTLWQVSDRCCVGRADVSVSPCQERVTTTRHCVLHPEKNDVSTRTGTMAGEIVFFFLSISTRESELHCHGKLLMWDLLESSQVAHLRRMCHRLEVFCSFFYPHHRVNVSPTTVYLPDSVSIKKNWLRNF